MSSPPRSKISNVTTDNPLIVVAPRDTSVEDNDNVVVISINNSIHIVTLIFKGKAWDPVKYEADEMIAGSGIESLLNKEGKRLMVPNMFALFNCNGGTLVFKDVLYNIQVESRGVEGKSDFGDIFVLMTLLVSWMFHTKYVICLICMHFNVMRVILILECNTELLFSHQYRKELFLPSN